MTMVEPPTVSRPTAQGATPWTKAAALTQTPSATPMGCGDGLLARRQPALDGPVEQPHHDSGGCRERGEHRKELVALQHRVEGPEPPAHVVAEEARQEPHAHQHRD